MIPSERFHRCLVSAFLLLLLPTFGCAIWEGGLGARVGASSARLEGRVELVGSEQGWNGPVLVYLEPLEAPLDGHLLSALWRLAGWSEASSEGTTEVRIRDGRQQPELVLVSPDQPFRFRNLDAIHHELFSVDASNAFEVGIGALGASDPVSLPQAGFVRAFCRLHPSESFALVVSPARRTVAVDRSRRFVLTDIEPGVYHVQATGLEVESAATRIRLVAGETLGVELRLSARSAR